MLVSRSTALSLDSLMPLVNACVLQDATAGTHFSAYPTGVPLYDTRGPILGIQQQNLLIPTSPVPGYAVSYSLVHYIGQREKRKAVPRKLGRVVLPVTWFLLCAEQCITGGAIRGMRAT